MTSPTIKRTSLACLLLLAAAVGSLAEMDCEGAAVEIVAAAADGSVHAVYGYPALFGAPLNATATPQTPLEAAQPLDACSGLAPAASPGAAALVLRGNCSFVDKAAALQQAGFSYMILFNHEPGCVLMSAGSNSSSTPGGLTLSAASISEEAGQLLLGLASAGANVTLREPRLPRVDVGSSVALWLMAVGTLVAGSAWSVAELRQQQAAAAGRHLEGQQHLKEVAGEEVAVITTRGALSFIVVASAMLLLMYFLIDTYLALLLVIFFAVGSWQTLSLVLLLLLYMACPPHWAGAHISLPRLGPTSALGLVANSTAAAVSITWFLFRHSHWAWALQDVLGVSLMLVILQQLRLPNLRVASILLPLAFLYDVWWVFLQPLVTGGDSVMIAVATGSPSEQLPMLLEWPRRALGTNTGFSMLGFGDVILPGLLVVFAARFDAAAGLPKLRGYFLPVLGGYGVGLVLTYGALALSLGGSHGQPALLYLVPCTLGCIAMLGWWRGQVGELWRGAPDGADQHWQQQDEEAGHLEAGLASDRAALLSSSAPRSPIAT